MFILKINTRDIILLYNKSHKTLNPHINFFLIINFFNN